MDLTIEQYEPDRHYHLFWPLFSKFWREVNDKNLECMVNTIVDTRIYVTTLLEQKLVNVLKEGKIIKIVFDRGAPIGFIQYKKVENGVYFMDSLYVLAEKRKDSIAGFMVNSLPEAKKFIFHVHKNHPPEVFLRDSMSCRKVGESNERDLEIWEGEYLPHAQKNNVVIKMKKEKKNV